MLHASTGVPRIPSNTPQRILTIAGLPPGRLDTRHRHRMPQEMDTTQLLRLAMEAHSQLTRRLHPQLVPGRRPQITPVIRNVIKDTSLSNMVLTHHSPQQMPTADPLPLRPRMRPQGILDTPTTP